MVNGIELDDNGLVSSVKRKGSSLDYYDLSQPGTQFDDLGKYDDGLTRRSNQEQLRAENQKGWGLLPTAAGRLIASTITKTLEGVAAMGTGFTENALSKEIADAEQHILNEWFPVYNSQGMESDSLMERLKEPGWWASTATDGAAFMLSAIVGSKGISAISKLGLAGKLAKGLGASDDILMQMDKLTRSTVGKVLGLEKNGVGAATAYGAFNEAFFESKGVIDQVKTQLSKDKYGTEFDYLNPEQQADVMQAAGKAGQQTFWGNLPVLLLTERIFNETILGNFFGLPEASAFSRIIKEGDQFKLNALTKGQRAALYGLPFAANIPTEMFQENYQLAVSNYFTKKATGQSTAGMLEGILGEMGDNFSTIEGKESMFLGGLLGGLGASASLGNIGKQDKYANQYLDILNGHYGTLNKAASTYFQKDNDGKILFENGMPKLKSQKDFDKEFEAITNNFEKYQIMSELRTAAELGDTSAAELYDIAVNDRFSETMFQLFQNPDSTQLVDTLIDSYAEKYAQEFEEITGKKADKQTKVKELKDKAERMQSLYNLAETYYQVEGQPASLPMQYHSLFKQDYFKQKAKEFREKSNEVLSQLPIEDKLKIEDAINKPNKNSNTIIDAVLDNADFSKIEGVADKVDTKANVAKALSFQSLYNLERQRFEKEFTKEEFYKKANEKVQEEATQAEEKAKKQAVVDEARRKRAEEIAKQEAAKKAAKTVTPAKPVQTTQPVQPTAPVTSETSTVVQESTSAPEIPGINRETIEDYFKNNDGKAATTIAREIDTPIENVKFWLDKLVEEGKLVKKGNNRYYKVSSEESQVEPDTTDTEAKKADIERRRQEELETTKNIGEDKLKEGRENTKKIVESLKQRYPATSVQGIIIRILEKLIDFSKYSTIIDSDYLNGRNASGQATWFGMIISQETLDGILAGKEHEVHTFIHEFIHGFTTSKISDYNIEKKGLIPGFKSKLTAKEKNAIEQLQRIFEKVKKDNPKSKEYGFTNLDEFIAEAFSNSSFQYTLKNTKAEGKKSNLFSEFINAVGDLLFEQLERWAKRFNKEIPERSTITGILEDVLAWTEDLIDQNNKLAYIATNEEINAKYDAELAALERTVPEIAPDIEPEIPFTIIADPTDKQVRTQNDFVLATEALSEGHNVLANRVVQMEKIFEGNIVQRVNKDGFVLDEKANTAAMHSNVKKGDTIQMSIPVDFMETPMYVDNKNDRTITFREHLSKVAPENYRQELIDNLPIKISHNGVDLGFVHRVDWINDTNLVEKEFVSFEEQKALLREFREQFIDATNSVATDLTVDTEITFKGPGKLARDISYKPLSEAAPSFPIAVVTGNRTVKTMDGKVITISHDATPGQAGFLYKDKFFVAKRKQLTDEDKQTLKELLLEPVKSVNKIASMVYASTIADTSKIQAALRNQKTPNNLRLGINKTSFYIYDHSTATVYNNSVEKLDEYLAQDLVANIIPSKENTEWASNNLLTNIREVKADYDGNVEPTIFVHNVVRFKLPKKQLSERVVPEVSTEPLQTELDAIERRRQEELNNIVDPRFESAEAEYNFHKYKQESIDIYREYADALKEETSPEKKRQMEREVLPEVMERVHEARKKQGKISSPDLTDEHHKIIEKQVNEINERYNQEIAALTQNVAVDEPETVAQPVDTEAVQKKKEKLKKKLGVELYPNVREEAEDLIKKCRT